MIPLPIAAALARIPAGLALKAGLALAFAGCFFLIGMGVHKTFSDRAVAKLRVEMAEKEADYQRKYTEAAQAQAAAEKAARDTERKWADELHTQELAYHAALRQRDRLVRDLAVAGDGLRDKLAAYTRGCDTASGSAAASSDLCHRVETLGVLLAERDRMAGESEQAADALRDELALCRGYAQVVSKKE